MYTCTELTCVNLLQSKREKTYSIGYFNSPEFLTALLPPTVAVLSLPYPFLAVPSSAGIYSSNLLALGQCTSLPVLVLPLRVSVKFNTKVKKLSLSVNKKKYCKKQ